MRSRNVRKPKKKQGKKLKRRPKRKLRKKQEKRPRKRLKRKLKRKQERKQRKTKSLRSSVITIATITVPMPETTVAEATT